MRPLIFALAALTACAPEYGPIVVGGGPGGGGVSAPEEGVKLRNEHWVSESLFNAVMISGRVTTARDGTVARTTAAYRGTESQGRVQRFDAAASPLPAVKQELECHFPTSACGPGISLRHTTSGDLQYVAGHFGGGLSGAWSDAEGSATSGGQTSTGFIARVSPAGQFDWRLRIGGTNGSIRLLDVAAFADGTFGVVGRYLGRHDLGAFHLDSGGRNERTFYARFDAAGAPVAVRDFGDPDFEPTRMAVSPSSQNLLIAGAMPYHPRYVVLDRDGTELATQDEVAPALLPADLAADSGDGWWVVVAEKIPDCGEHDSTAAERWTGTGLSELRQLDSRAVVTRKYGLSGNATAVAASDGRVSIAGSADRDVEFGDVLLPVSGGPKVFVLSLGLSQGEPVVSGTYVGNPSQRGAVCRVTGVGNLPTGVAVTATFDETAITAWLGWLRL